MYKFKLTFVLLATLASVFSPVTQAQQNTAVTCTDSARILVDGSRPQIGKGTSSRSSSSTEMYWSTAEGYKGVCRMDASGRLYAVEITEFPVNSMAKYNLTCSSISYRRKECGLRGPGSAQLNRQLSIASCTQGRTWGVSGSTLWVGEGCSGAFTITPQAQWAPYSLTCESHKDRRQECPLKSGAAATLTKRLSNKSCQKGSSWGVDQDRLWVDRGCRAVFSVTPASAQDQGLSGIRAAALQSCNALVRSRGMTVIEERIVDMNDRHVDIEFVAERNRVRVDMYCLYNIQNREPKLFGG